MQIYIYLINHGNDEAKTTKYQKCMQIYMSTNDSQGNDNVKFRILQSYVEWVNTLSFIALTIYLHINTNRGRVLVLAMFIFGFGK